MSSVKDRYNEAARKKREILGVAGEQEVSYESVSLPLKSGDLAALKP